MWKHSIHLILLVMALALAPGGNAYGFDALGDPALVAWWSFDEGTGTTAADSSPNGNDGTLEGGASWVPGRFGSAIELDGTSGYVSIPDFELTTDTITFVIWLNGWRGGDWAPFISSRAVNACEMNFGDNNTLHYTWNGDSSATWGWTGGPVIPQDTWTMLAVTIDPDKAVAYVYTDAGGLVQATNAIAHIEQTVGALQIGYSYDPRYVRGILDEAAVFSRALTEEEILALTQGPTDPTLAAAPSPMNEATDVPRDDDLSWTAGAFAAKHDVYLGTSLDDVNSASRADPMGLLVSQGQTATTYDPGRLEFGQTYYWRVDEVNAAPSNTIFKGEVWNFTVEPFAYPVANIIATSNATSDPTSGPEKMVDGSGLNAAGLHSVNADDMWLGVPGADPLTIQFEFDQVYKLDQMLVWNYNVMFEMMLGFGLKDVTVEYSVDGTDWTVLGDVQFAQATAKATYAANTTVDFAGVAVKYVKFTVNSGYGPLGQFGLSEVRFMYIPVTAREPQPSDGQTGVSPTGVLGWRPGREAASHEVYLSGDEAAVADGTALAGTVADASYPLSGLGLDLDSTYYWKVNEVNDVEAVSSWEGKVWSFTTQEFFVIDDFESYGEPEGNRIYEIWIDGWENGTGSTVGHLDAPFVEEDTVHGGGQSMPLFVDNAGVTVAEAELTLSPAQDWTAMGIQSLALYFHGAPDNTGQLYLKINNTRVDYGGDTADITRAQWQPWNVDLSEVGGNLSSVAKLTIGVEGAGAVGVVYIDDVRLYPRAPEFIIPVEPDPAGLVLYYALDEGSGNVATDSSGSGNNGTIEGSPAWITGVSGSALGFDGSRDYVATGKSLLDSLAEFTIACWLKGDLSLGNRSGLVGQNDCIEYGVVSANTIQIYSNGEAVDLAWPYDATTDWHSIVAVGDGSSVTIYLDGKPAVSGGTAIDEVYGSSTYPVNIGGGGIFDATDNWFTGDVDEVYIYQRALSAGEVAGLAGRTEPIYKPF